MFARAVLVGAFAALAAAQSSVLTFTHVPDPITDGQPAAITYATNDTATPVTIILRQGPSNSLKTVETLTTTATNGQYIWTACSALPDGSNYALEIKQGNQINYFGPFSIQGMTGSGSCSGVSSSASSTGATAVGGAGGHSMTSSSSNATMTGSGSSMGTGTAMHRNSTMSSATLTSSMSSHKTNTATVTTSSPMASFPGTKTAPASSPTSSNAASNDYSGSSLALVLGAVAAIVMG